MNPQSETSSPAAANHPQSAIRSPLPNENPQPSPRKPGRGRPRALDNAKRREICALVAGGCTTKEAARYVHCSPRTIRREAARDPEFDANLRHSEMYAELSPLRAMQHAVATHWRAAAWFLERAYPERFARRNQNAWGLKQVRQLYSEVLNIIISEVVDPIQIHRIQKRMRMTFDYLLHTAGHGERTSRDIRLAIEYFEEKDRLNHPMAKFGFRAPDIDALLTPKPPAARPTTRKSPTPGAQSDEPTPNKPPTADGAAAFGHATNAPLANNG